jgi:tRNA dimethylallyltransferase
VEPEPPLLVIVGPTASGKTELAVRLAEASNGEVLSADSVQVYRYFDIGSGKPTPEQCSRARHHFVDLLDPLDSFDAARWASLAQHALQEIRARGRTPIVCGGTFLWVRALLYGLAEAPPANPVLREQHAELAARLGRAALHAELAQVDPLAAQRLNPNDLVRVSRALEVFALTGVPISQWQAQHGFRTPRYMARLIGIQHPREELDRRIAQRATEMLCAGWVDEVRALLDRGYQQARAMSSVGYRQITEALQASEMPSVEALTDSIYRSTRVFARRQRTWLREQPVHWLTPEEASTEPPQLLLQRLFGN